MTINQEVLAQLDFSHLTQPFCLITVTASVYKTGVSVITVLIRSDQLIG